VYFAKNKEGLGMVRWSLKVLSSSLRSPIPDSSSRKEIEVERITTMKVYVVAWEYGGGGGFDWYPDPDAASQAWKEEQKNCIAFAKENWEAVTFEYETQNVGEAITTEIDHQLPELFDKATTRYKAEQ
jgi:sugar phosphate isomerase/epimerase